MISVAEVYKSGVLAATLERASTGVSFTYRADYIAAGGPAVASTLPVSGTPAVTPAGAVPPYFAGLLPEGRRLSVLRRAVKASADDELTLLVAVGADTIGDVQVIALGKQIPDDPTSLTVTKRFDELRFAEVLGREAVGGRPALAGVQDKASASMISVPIARKHERYILKLNPPENPHLVENEAWFLDVAQRCGVVVAQHRVVRDADGEPGLLVTRFDRVVNATAPGDMIPLAMEDACQALNLWPADKYNTTAEEACLALMVLTAAPLVAARDLLRQLTFAWLSGNGDVHAKNLSVLQKPDGERRISPAYDLPSTLLYGDTTLALTIGGRDTVTAPRLRAFAAGLGLPTAVSEKVIVDLLTRTSSLAEELTASNLPFDRRVLDKAARQLAARHRSLGV